jgi:hypothetical protein
MWIYTSAPPYALHGVVINQLSTGTAFFTNLLRTPGADTFSQYEHKLRAATQEEAHRLTVECNLQEAQA